MSGTKYLLDTNFILGLLKSDAQVLAEFSSRRILAGECAYSSITRMELLGFHRITREEEALINQKLAHFSCLPLSLDIENKVIALRQSRKIKLPDAMIAATALNFDIELLTLDQHLLEIVRSENRGKQLP